MTNWKYILIVVILAIFVGVGVFYQWQALKEEAKISESEIPEKTTETPEKETIEDEIADWKTHRNEKYGFEVKYPDNWIMDEEIYEKEQLYVVSFSNEQKFEVGVIDIKVRPTNYFLISDWGEDQMNYSTEAYGKIYDEMREVKLEEGIIGRQLLSVIEGGKIVTGFIQNNFLYEIILYGQEWEPRKSEIEIIYNQMLSTFRFLQPEEITDWKTYRNEEYGFEMKYPKELPVEQGGPLVKPNVFYFNGGPYETAISLVVSDISEKEAVSLSEETEITEIIVAGEKGMRYKEEWEVPAGWQRGVFVEAHTNQSITVDIEYQGRNYRFHLTDSIENQDAFEIFDQILSTFRFLK